MSADQWQHSSQATNSLIIEGGGGLQGEIRTSGFKHSLVGIIAAAAATDRTIEIRNCPDIAESHVLSGLLQRIGGFIRRCGATVAIDCGQLQSGALDLDLSGSIHGAVYLLPSLVGRFGRARVRINGGCQIGAHSGQRPVAHYVSILGRFGAHSTISADGCLEVSASRLQPCEIDLLDYARDRELRTGHMYSGATKTALLSAVAAHGVSVLHHPYPKPDVTDVVSVLTGLGADIETTRAGALVIHGHGHEALRRDVTHTLIPDLIEVITWICAASALGTGPLRIAGPDMARACSALAPDLAVLREMGARFDASADSIIVHPNQDLRAVDVTAASHGVFSDNQPFLALLATGAPGVSRITDTVWTGRFGYLPGLMELGCDLEQHGSTLSVRGPCRPWRPGQHVHADDLRAAAVLLLAAVAVPGRTVVSGTAHLVRGYPDLAGSLRSLGARIGPAGALPEGTGRLTSAPQTRKENVPC
jgi:UDP-N-acetylglucosamine 1-carboxyvinyltransferase